MNTKVSIIVPFYNREKSLMDRCVDSVLKQTYTDFECLIIDDGSYSKYAKFLDHYEVIDSRIRVMHKNNGGAGNTRNYGISHMDGGYLFFLDSDDYISPYTLEIGMRLAVESDADMIVGGLKHVETDEDPGFQNMENRSQLVESQQEKEALIMHFSGIKQAEYNMMNGSTGTSPCSRFVKKEIAKQVQFENDRYWDEDDLWNISLVSRCDKILVVDICWYAYVINPSSMVRSYSGDRTEEFVMRAKQEYERIKELWPGCMQGAYHHIWDGLLRYCRTDTFHILNKKNKNQKYYDFCNAINFEEFKEAISNINFSYERRIKYRIVKNAIKRLLMFSNKRSAYLVIGACIKRVKF